MSILIDPSIQTQTGWKKVTGQGIGGITPTDYGYIQDPFSGNMMFYTSGPGYADWLAANPRPLQSNTGNLILLFSVMTDANAPNLAQALEFDTRVSIGGWNYNFSSQLNYNLGGVFQISDQAGAWVNTGYKPGKLAPNVWYTFQYVYEFNQVSRRYSMISIEIKNTRYMIPGSLQNLVATNMGWADSCSLQVQLDLASAGGSFSHMMRDVNYIWS